mgnify:FL=1
MNGMIVNIPVIQPVYGFFSFVFVFIFACFFAGFFGFSQNFKLSA